VTGIEVRSGVWDVLAGKRMRKRPLGRARCKRDLNIQKNVMTISWSAWTALK
jgi:hypothetical protein